MLLPEADTSGARANTQLVRCSNAKAMVWAGVNRLAMHAPNG